MHSNSGKVNINATRCAEYLNRIGVVVSAETAAQWVAQERESRAMRRAHNRELKRSCGHFRTHRTDIYSENGHDVATYCSDCGRCTDLKPVPPTPPRRRRRKVA